MPAADEVIPERLFGRAEAIRLVRDLMDRPPADGLPGSRWLPVLLFVAPGDSGKSALLAHLGGRLDQNVPHARLDFAEMPSAGIEEVLALLVFELNRHCASYGRLAFPRFIVGRIVMAATDVDHRDPAKARARISEVLEEYRSLSKLRAFVEDMTAGVLTVLGLPGSIGGHVSGLLVRGLTAGRFGRRAILGPGQQWYEHLDRGVRGRDALSGLVELHRRAGDRASEADRQWVGEVLLAAFLADLRDGFGTDRKAALNCVLLLDNADEPAGTRFLERLVRARRRSAGTPQGRPDPVTVVAASRGRLPRRVSVPVRPEPEDLGARTGEGRWWYPLALRDLTEDEVDGMAAPLMLRRFNPDHVTLLVHGFTRGHPGSTRVLLDALAEHDEETGDDAPLPELRTILARQVPGAPRTTVRQWLQDRLLGAGTRESELAEDLIACSAARDQREARRLAADGGPLRYGDTEELLRPDLWTADENPVMHPVLRRLLLERLAARDEHGWEETFGYLRAGAERDGDRPGTLHHALALGEHRYVCEELAGSLRGADAGEWLSLVRAVTAAPNRLEFAGSPGDEAARLAEWADPGARPLGPVARLVAALWISSDPLTGRGRRVLHAGIARTYGDLAPFFATGLDELQKEVDRHAGLAARWC